MATKIGSEAFVLFTTVHRAKKGLLRTQGAPGRRWDAHDQRFVPGGAAGSHPTEDRGMSPNLERVSCRLTKGWHRRPVFADRAWARVPRPCCSARSGVAGERLCGATRPLCVDYGEGRGPGTPRDPGDPKGTREALDSRPATTLDGWPDGRGSLGGRMAGWPEVPYLGEHGGTLGKVEEVREVGLILRSPADTSRQ